MLPFQCGASEIATVLLKLTGAKTIHVNAEKTRHNALEQRPGVLTWMEQQPSQALIEQNVMYIKITHFYRYIFERENYNLIAGVLYLNL